MVFVYKPHLKVNDWFIEQINFAHGIALWGRTNKFKITKHLKFVRLAKWTFKNSKKVQTNISKTINETKNKI